MGFMGFCGIFMGLNGEKTQENCGKPQENGNNPQENGGWMEFDDGFGWDSYGILWELPSGKRLHNYGKSPFLMGESIVSIC